MCRILKEKIYDDDDDDYNANDDDYNEDDDDDDYNEGIVEEIVTKFCDIL